mgnify:CR=1 FL=1
MPIQGRLRIRAERQKYLGSLMRQFAIISESIALLSMTKISFYLYVIMYQVMAFDMQWLIEFVLFELL